MNPITIPNISIPTIGIFLLLVYRLSVSRPLRAVAVFHGPLV